MNKFIKTNDYLLLISMIYIAIDLSSMVFAYKIIAIGPIIGAASSIIFPLTYSVMDIIAEVYGYQTAKKIIWYGFLCDVIFAFFVFVISQIPSISETQTTAYVTVLGTLLRAVFAQMAGVLAGAFINIYLISKWKIITNGRYFWLRSIGSSTIGEAIMLIISVLIALGGILSAAQLFNLIIYTYFYKIIFAIMIAPIVKNIVAIFLKSTMEVWQADTAHFNPFDTQDKQDFFPKLQKL